ncbi:MAG TPA: hypothetical protein EYP17_04140 [Candidatus Latescibacteria bacterium]|nr:hypothetical protein [Candidatus Latescibacterota bacterium]
MAEALFPAGLLEALSALRPVFHAASWESFLYLLAGLLVGQAKAGVVRASLLAPPSYTWRRLLDFLRRNRWSGLKLMGALTSLILSRLYPEGLPAHLFWVLDLTYLEKPYARTVEGILSHWRPHRKAGQGHTLKGHGVVVVGHLFHQRAQRFRAFLLGGLLYLKQATPVELGGDLFSQLPLPQDTHNVLVVDRGLCSLKLAKAVRKQGVYLVGRLKRNAILYLPASEADYKGRGRRPIYGAKFRADEAPKEQMTRTEMLVPVDGTLRWGVVYRGTFLRRGFTQPVELLRVEVGTLPPWLLLVTDPTLTTEEAIWAYYGRSQVEVGIGETKALGLGAYRGRRLPGISRWPMVLGVVHSLLQLMAVGALKVELPRQGWPWYPKENTVGAIQRRLSEWFLRGHFSDFLAREQKFEEMREAA